MTDFGDSANTFVQLVPFFVLGIPIAIGNGYLAARMRRNVATWVILSLIPLVNYGFAFYVAYTVVFYVIDRLNELTGRSVRAS